MFEHKSLHAITVEQMVAVVVSSTVTVAVTVPCAYTHYTLRQHTHKHIKTNTSQHNTDIIEFL